MPSPIEILTQRVAESMPVEDWDEESTPVEDRDEGGVGIAFALLLLVVKAVMLGLECFHLLSERDMRRIRRPGPIVRWKVRRIVKKALVANGEGDHVDAVVKGLLKAAAATTVDEFNAAIAEFNTTSWTP